ncbi:MAG: HAD family hydrolase [Proteobacteria bacterium]|nr:HAD family hydrolase [Pseudomonadota bacterium]
MMTHLKPKTSLLASDLDGTVIPFEPGPERDAEIQEFNRLMADNEHVGLAYVTGRHLELALAGVSQYRLPVPDIFVCDVGTTIYLREGKNWVVDQEFRNRLKTSWKGFSGSDIARILRGIKGLTPQEAEKQKEFKQSYYVPVTLDYREMAIRIKDRLAGKNVRANVIYSVGCQNNIGLVDVLPQRAAKDYALAYLWRKLGLKKERVVYAGDSGNDLLAFVSGFNAVVVANASGTVKEEVRRLTGDKGIADKVFFASERYVKGVMEGCFHFKLFSQGDDH